MNDTKQLMNNLAQLCGETNGGIFAITCLKDKSWQVAFPNAGILSNTKGKDIDSVLIEAINEIKTKRVPIETETKFTVYKY